MLLGVSFVLGLGEAAAQTLLYVEAESAQVLGTWTVDQRTEAYNGAGLRGDTSNNTNNPTTNATLTVAIATTGTYNVWVRSRDFDTFPGQRRFQIGLDGTLFSHVCGATGVTNGFWWENVGSRALSAGNHILSLFDLSHYYARADAFFLAGDGTDPNTLTYAQLATYQAGPPPVPFGDVALYFNTASDVANNIRALANGALLGFNTNDGGILRFSAPSSSSLATAVYDSAPSDGISTNNIYRNVTVTTDVRFGDSQQSFGIFTRIPGEETNSHLALISCETGGTGTADTFTIYGAGCDPRNSTVSGTVVSQTTVSVLNPGTWYTVSLTVQNTGTGGAIFTLQAYDRTSGDLLWSKTATNSSGAITAAGEVGFRFYSTRGGASDVIDMDNLLITEKVPGFYSGAPHTLLATIQGSGMRSRFYSQPDIDGVAQITRETAVWISNNWVTVPFIEGDEQLFVQYRNSVTLDTSQRWTNLWSLTTGGTTQDPFQAAKMEVLIPRSCSQVDSQTVAVTCISVQGRTVQATWKLGAGGGDLLLTASGTADAAGYYSLGLSSFSSCTAAQRTCNVLEPLFQFQRLPLSPRLLTTSCMPQPMALVQRTFSGISQPVTYGVVAEPTQFAFAFPSQRNAEYGFSILNTDGTIQPAAFNPILGLKGSQLGAGAPLAGAWRVLAIAGDWKAGLEYASSQVLGVTDYRQPYRSSLTHALLNMIDLATNDFASGWDPNLKGPLQIEAQSTVTQPSPLTFISLALLTRNESFYQTRSLPTLEFSVSRPRQHFATDATTNNSSYINTAATQITIPSTFDGTAYWQGAHDLLGRRNPWIAGMALNNGSVRYDTGGTQVPRWLEEMGQYRLSPSPSLLQTITNDCNSWISSQFSAPKTDPVTDGVFYHYGAYPYWWGLLDLYELTTNSTYLAYAEEGAFHTIGGIFSHPMAEPGATATANPGGELVPGTQIWWKGADPYRLGWPRSPGDTPERAVPAWLVSLVGYTIEQPITYYATGGGDPKFQPIMMAAWAPQLLRLYRLTGRDIYQTYARNAVIGRFSTEPGYYLHDFTDMFHETDYPYDGPDISSFYYHHFQARLSLVLDYLMAQAETMSLGKVAFPWAKQFGYVWFTDRVFGMPGCLYGQTNLWPWFDRSAAQVNTEQVDYLFARGQDSFWVVLMNQTNAAVTINLTNSASALGTITSLPVKAWQADQSLPEMPYAPTMAVTIPGRTLVALRFATQSRDVFPRAVPLTASSASQTLTGQWGTMQAFRTRSPFGSDSLYVVLTGRPTNSTTAATLQLNGAAPIAESAYPYEFSVYPWPMNQDMVFSLKLVAGATTNYSTAVTLAGTTNTPSTAYQDWKASNGLATNAPDGGDTDGDGWCNLLEYAFNMNPQLKDAPAPLLGVVTNGTFTITYIKWRSDVTYIAETSQDLNTWTTQGVTETADGANVTASVPISAQCCFLRVRVTYP